MKTRVLMALAAAPLGHAALWLGLARAQGPAPPPKPRPDHFAQLRRVWGGRAHNLDMAVKDLIAGADQIAINHDLPCPDQSVETVPLKVDPFSIGTEPSPEEWIDRLRSVAKLCQVEAHAYRNASRGDYKTLSELESLRIRNDRDEAMRLIQEIDQKLRRLERPRQWAD